MQEKAKIFDNHGRPISYLRLAVTDRCNLRCFYCMPAEGINYLPRKELLSYEEMLKLVNLLTELGVEKVRITGGEPFVRKDLMKFLKNLTEVKDLKEVSITTNGILTSQYIAELKALGISSINLSLDTLDKDKFYRITRRNEFDKVKATFHAILDHEIPLKINTVVMEAQNEEDILPLVELTKQYPVSVRFIEEMPFNGEGAKYPQLKWTYQKIVDHIGEAYPNMQKTEDQLHSTSYNYAIPGHLGNFGVIAAFSRTFCGSCNRIRVTAQGTLKTCLYDHGVLDIKQLLRSGKDDSYIKEALIKAFGNRAKDGFEAEANRSSNIPISESMSTIGG